MNAQQKKMIKHIAENLDKFRQHQMDSTLTTKDVESYFFDNDPDIYWSLCSDLGLTPRFPIPRGM